MCEVKIPNYESVANSLEWFDSETSEKLILRGKLFKKYKHYRFHVGKEINKTAWDKVQKFMAKETK